MIAWLLKHSLALAIILYTIFLFQDRSSGHLRARLPTHCRGPHVRLPAAAEEGEEDALLPGLVQNLRDAQRGGQTELEQCLYLIEKIWTELFQKIRK